MQHENRSKTQNAPLRNGLEAIKRGEVGNHLTGKQEKFALSVASGMTQADAYRAAYNAGNMKPVSVQVNASKLMADANIALRVETLRAQIGAKLAEEMSYDYFDAMKEAAMVMSFAKDNAQSGTMGQMVALRSKLSGLMVEDRKNDRSPIAGMSYEQTKSAIEALAAIKKARATNTGQSK